MLRQWFKVSNRALSDTRLTQILSKILINNCCCTILFKQINYFLYIFSFDNLYSKNMVILDIMLNIVCSIHHQNIPHHTVKHIDDLKFLQKILDLLDRYIHIAKLNCLQKYLNYILNDIQLLNYPQMILLYILLYKILSLNQPMYIFLPH